jgi:hypothetical protein
MLHIEVQEHDVPPGSLIGYLWLGWSQDRASPLALERKFEFGLEGMMQK